MPATFLHFHTDRNRTDLLIDSVTGMLVDQRDVGLLYTSPEARRRLAAFAGGQLIVWGALKGVRPEQALQTKEAALAAQSQDGIRVGVGEMTGTYGPDPTTRWEGARIAIYGPSEAVAEETLLAVAAHIAKLASQS